MRLWSASQESDCLFRSSGFRVRGEGRILDVRRFWGSVDDIRSIGDLWRTFNEFLTIQRESKAQIYYITSRARNGGAALPLLLLGRLTNCSEIIASRVIVTRRRAGAQHARGRACLELAGRSNYRIHFFSHLREDNVRNHCIYKIKISILPYSSIRLAR